MFGALNHDDSRAINTLDMLVGENGRKFIRHYMLDFGSLSAAHQSGATRQRVHDRKGPTLPDCSRSASDRALAVSSPGDRFLGRTDSGDVFGPRMEAEYPNQAFKNMRPTTRSGARGL